MSQSGLGRVFNVIYTASGVSVPLTAGTAVTYLCADPGSGDATLTFTQTISGASSTALNIGTGNNPANLGSQAYVGPDDGASAWVATAATGANVFTSGGATNDTLVVTVRAEQLADGYNCVVATAANGGTCVAIIHDLLVARKPSNLKPAVTV
jgi:hypothetical protein